MERLQGKPARSALILDLVVGDARAARWDFPQRIFVDTYAIETSVGDADPECSAAFRLLTPRYTGIVASRRNICVSSGRCFFTSAAYYSYSFYFESCSFTTSLALAYVAYPLNDR